MKVEGPLKGEKLFQFGNEGVLKSISRYRLPAVLGDKEVLIDTEIIDSDIPLLLSKEAMKKSGMVLYLSEDTAVIFEKRIPLNTTTAGHYLIPLLKNDKPTHLADGEVLQFEEVLAANLVQASLQEK